MTVTALSRFPCKHAKKSIASADGRHWSPFRSTDATKSELHGLSIREYVFGPTDVIESRPNRPEWTVGQAQTRNQLNLDMSNEFPRIQQGESVRWSGHSDDAQPMVTIVSTAFEITLWASASYLLQITNTAEHKTCL